MKRQTIAALAHTEQELRQPDLGDFRRDDLGQIRRHYRRLLGP